MAIKIDPAIPIPRDKHTKSDERIALETMGVGDSFAFDEAQKGRVKMAAATIKMWSGKKFSVRGLRVWRTE